MFCFISRVYRVIRSDEGLTLETSALESLYGGQISLSTMLTKPNGYFRGSMRYNYKLYSCTLMSRKRDVS